MNDNLLKVIPSLIIFFNVIFFNTPIFAVQLKSFKASPDQVLVLYNSDWTKDVDGSTPGQDSKEVAEYYQKMHTDPINGKKPFLLGLKCVHGIKHLNEWKISEKSQDNKDGIVFIGKGKGPEVGEWARDSRKVEIVINTKKNEVVDWESVSFLCRNSNGIEKKAVDILVSGVPQNKGRQVLYPEVESGKGRCYRFDAHTLSNGTITILVKAKDKTGNIIRDLHFKYYDRDDFKFSQFGPDGIVDEKNFQEDVAIPVKAFLESHENSLLDGTLFKELYLIYGCLSWPAICL